MLSNGIEAVRVLAFDNSETATAGMRVVLFGCFCKLGVLVRWVSL